MEGGLISLRSFRLLFGLPRSIFNAFKDLPLRPAEFPGADTLQADRMVSWKRDTGSLVYLACISNGLIARKLTGEKAKCSAKDRSIIADVGRSFVENSPLQNIVLA